MAYLNQKLWKISYLLEFWQDKTVTDAFAFSVPVQNEDYTFPQRIAETKTFGGVVIDDYGNDIVTINLSGTTINQDVKIIYKGSKGFSYLTGKEEIFYLQSLIEKYGKTENLKNKKVMLYELNGGNKAGTNLKHYQIFITNFQIKRSKEKPFCYDYTLQAKSCLEKEKSTLFLNDLKEKKSIKSDIKKLTEDIETLEKIQSKIFGAIDKFIAALNDLKRIVSAITDYIERYEALITGTIDKLTDTISEIQSIGDSIIDTAMRLNPKYIMTNILSSCKNLIQSVDSLVEWWQDFSEGEKYQQIEDSYEGTKSDLKDNITILNLRLKKDSESLVEAVHQELGSVSFVVMPDKQDSITKSYGFSKRKVSAADSWEKLSYETYGTSEYSNMLALFNNQTTLTAGESVALPILDESKDTIEGNEIARQYGIFDNSGKDINIKNGDLSIENGDLACTSDIETVNLGISSRLATSLNSRVRNVVYGIRTNVGDSNDVASSYILESIKDTILADPRIDSIEKLSWEGINDKMKIDLIYITKDGIEQNYIGEI